MKTVFAYIRYGIFLTLVLLLYFFNNHTAFLMMLIATLAAPVISIVLFYVSSPKITFGVDTRSDILYRDEKTSVCLTAQNNSLYPFSHAFFWIVISNDLNPNTIEHCYDLYVAPKESMRFEIPVGFSDCGNYPVRLSKVKIRDLFGLVSKTVLVSKASEIVVFPLEIQIDETLEGAGGTPNEDTVYERNAKGSDPSEIFEIREYRMGDRPQQIHWKLSAKQQDLMAKEFSDVIGESFEIFLCNDYTDNHQMNAYYDLMYSIGRHLASKGIFFSYSFYSEQDEVIQKVSVNSEEKVAEVLLMMYYLQKQKSNRTAFQLISSVPGGLGHIMVLTSQPFPLKEQARQIINLNNLVRLWAL